MKTLILSIPKRIQLNSRLLIALLLAEAFLLSSLHHRFNFWGWPWDKQVFVVCLIAPILGLVIYFLLGPVWPSVLQIRWQRWMLFLAPAVAIAALAAWRILTLPEVPHRLQIEPMPGAGSGEIQLVEIKGPYGTDVPLSSLDGQGGWTLANGVLRHTGAGSKPLQYSFSGPIQEQIRLTFLSTSGGAIRATLDGRTAVLDLTGPGGEQRRLRLDTQFRWGLLNFLIVPLVVLADFYSILSLLALLWLMQETTQAGNIADAGPGRERFLSHRQGLLLVCLLAIILHAINFLSIPLAVLKDSPSYLQGAFYWVQHHNLDGVSSYRGLGTTLIFTPFMAPFGRNPLGLKLILHLLAIACVPLVYRLGWQLARRHWLAFFAALFTALIPDLYAYSSYVLSEGPHVFSSLLFCTLLISALEMMSAGWILSALLAGSFAILVRSENAAAVLIGVCFLLGRMIWMHRKSAAEILEETKRPSVKAWQLALAVLLATAPLLAWSVHNQARYGFFGLSDYGGEILYDGWIYFGGNSHIPILDGDSPAVRTIEAAYPALARGDSGAPTGWAVYDALVRQGYTSEQAFSLLEQASLDSIRKDPSLTWRLLQVKIQQGFEPHPFIPGTFLFPGESPAFEFLNSAYFDDEHIFIPPLIHLQRFINGLIARSYVPLFAGWFWSGLLMLFICLYRRPFFRWAPLCAIALDSIFLPTVVGMSMWRYVLLGTVLMSIPLLAGAQSIALFIDRYLHLAGLRRSELRQPEARISNPE